MTESNDLQDIPQAIVAPGRRMRFSAVWIIPIVAALVAVGIAVQRILNEGPTITITFKVAEGVEAGKTFVKYKDVNIGQVTKVTLSDDYSHVVVTAKMTKNARNLLVKDTKFWIMQPRVTLKGISGIGTLVSGNYIGLDVGKSTEKQKVFKGLDEPPIITSEEPGRHFLLKANDLGSVDFGSPVYYRRRQVGQVIGCDLAEDGMSVSIKIFVNAPYDRFVNTNSVFWQASGIHVSLGASGIAVQTQSLKSLLSGGIAFETPPHAQQATTPAPENAQFTLYEDEQTAMTEHDRWTYPFILIFNEPLRGLSVGAPMTYLGIEVGQVKEITFHYDAVRKTLKPKVLVLYYPERVIALLQNRPFRKSDLGRTVPSIHKLLQKLIDQGLRAQLRSSNLVTGQLYIALDYFPKAPKAQVDWKQTPPQFPVMQSGMTELQTKIADILEKIDKIPFDEIGRDAKQTLDALEQTLKDVRRVLGRVDQDLVPGMKTTLENVKRAAAAAERFLANADKTLTGPDAAANQELRNALQEITRAAQSLRVLAEYLDNHPEALLRGKAQEKSP